MPTDNNNQPRLPIIDQLRGIAVCLMAIFHFCYDLSVFGFIPFTMNGGFYSWFRFLIVTLFFTSVGASLYLAHSDSINWKPFWQRSVKIGSGAAFITLTTYFMYPSNWVYFGVLHFILLASILTLPVIRAPRLAIITGIVIFVLYNLTDWFNLSFLYQISKAPLNLPNGTQDLTRLIPWLGMVYIGVYFGYVRFWGLKEIPLGALNRTILFLSRHSLIFYVIHQAPLFGLAYLLDRLIH